MRAAIYSRKSRFTGKGDSIENQIQLCKDYAVKIFGISEKDFVIYEDEGFSGGNINRPQFQQLLRDAMNKRFDILICYRLDRISRNVSDFSQLIRDLEKYGIGFVSIREQFDTTTPMGRAMMYISSVFAQLERETIAERIRDNMVQLAKTGRWLGGVTPTGYKSVQISDNNQKEKKLYRLEEIDEEIELVKTIYKKFIELQSLTRVESFLLTNNVKTKNGFDFKRYTIRFILSNPVYAIADNTTYDYLIKAGYDIYSSPEQFSGVYGLMAYNKTKQDMGTVERPRANDEWVIAIGRHEGIIPGEIWVQAQNLLERNKAKSYRKEKNNQALLSGLLKCGKCGSYMRPKVTNRTNSNNEQVFYYMCEMKEKSKRTRCGCKNLLGNEADYLLLQRLKGVFDNYCPAFNNIPVSNKLFFSFVNTRIKAESIPSKLRDIDASLVRLTNVLAKNNDKDIEEALLLQMGRLTKEKRQLEEKLELCTPNKADKEAVSDDEEAACVDKAASGANIEAACLDKEASGADKEAACLDKEASGTDIEATYSDKDISWTKDKTVEDQCRINDSNSTSYNIRLINNLWWHQMDNKYKKMMIKSMVKQILWYEDKIVVELHGS